MRRFLVSFKEFPIRLEEVREGTNPPEVMTASRCVNVGLFLSGDMRRDVEVNISVGKEEELGVISFPGWQLRRVSPDERSISYFLLKAFKELSGLGKGKPKEMPNGIVVMNTDLVSLIESWDNPEVFVASAGTERETAEKTRGDGVYIYETKTGLLQDCCNISTQPIYRPARPERLILDINLDQDRKQAHIEKSS